MVYITVITHDLATFDPNFQQDIQVGKDRLPVPPFFRGENVKLWGCLFFIVFFSNFHILLPSRHPPNRPLHLPSMPDKFIDKNQKIHRTKCAPSTVISMDYKL